VRVSTATGAIGRHGAQLKVQLSRPAICSDRQRPCRRSESDEAHAYVVGTGWQVVHQEATKGVGRRSEYGMAVLDHRHVGAGERLSVQAVRHGARDIPAGEGWGVKEGRSSDTPADASGTEGRRSERLALGECSDKQREPHDAAGRSS